MLPARYSISEASGVGSQSQEDLFLSPERLTRRPGFFYPPHAFEKAPAEVRPGLSWRVWIRKPLANPI